MCTVCHLYSAINVLFSVVLRSGFAGMHLKKMWSSPHQDLHAKIGIVCLSTVKKICRGTLNALVTSGDFKHVNLGGSKVEKKVLCMPLHITKQYIHCTIMVTNRAHKLLGPT